MSTGCYGQGLNSELGFNAHFDQTSKGVVVIDEYSYLVRRQAVTPGFSTYHYLMKLDTLGNVVFDNLIPIAAEYAEVVDVVNSNDNSVCLYGNARPTCDVANGCFWFVYKYDSNGILLWSKTWSNEFCIEVQMSGLTVTDSSEIFINHVVNNVSKIYTISTLGDLTDSLTNDAFHLVGIESTSAYRNIAYKDNVMYGIENTGAIIDSVLYNTIVEGFDVVNDTVFVLTQDSIFVYDSSLQEIFAGNVPSCTSYSDLKVKNDVIEFISNQGSSIKLITLSHDLVEIENMMFPVELNGDGHIGYGNEHLIATINFDLTDFQTIRTVDFSRTSSLNEIVNWTDIGIIDIFPNQTTTVFVTQPLVYNYQVWADVLVKNYGTNTLNECRINHFISPYGICQPNVYTEHFDNLNLLPGDSMWISLGLIHNETLNFSSDTLLVNICVYTSHPNLLTDLIVPNDNYCEFVLLGHVGLKELEHNKKDLLKIVDLMGLETLDKPNTTLIYVYSDGTTEKVYRME
jgi:hypothetical protein